MLPVVATLAGRHPERTAFTRWRAATRERIDLKFARALAALCPPATVIDKTRDSGFAEPRLPAHRRGREADALIISGSETDICVLATS